jgi:GxxExxY protein
MDLIYKEEAYKIIGCAMKVHAELGPGFLESVYHEALEIMFQLEEIPYQHEPILKVEFMGYTLKKEHIPDFTCHDKIIVELKAQSELIGINRAQTISYLKASKYKLGLLINFGAEYLQHERLVRNITH